MAVERDKLSLNFDELGITSTEELDPISLGESFLEDEPVQIQPVKKSVPKKKREEDDEDEEEEQKRSEKKQQSFKEVVVRPNQISEDDLFNEGEEEEQEEEEEPIKIEKPKPTVKKPEPEVETQPALQADPPTEPELNEYESVAQTLAQQGILLPEEDEEGNPIDIDIKDAPSLLKKLQIDSQRRVSETLDKFLDRHGDDYREMFDAVFVNGVKPEEYLAKFTKIQGMANLDLSSEDSQERVVRELYKSEGRSAEYIEKRIGQLKNYSDLADEAAEAHRILIEREQESLEKLSKEKEVQNQRKHQIRQQYVESVGKILNEKYKLKEFNGIPIDKKFVAETYEHLTEQKYQTADGQLLSDFDKDILDLNRPDNHELKVMMSMLLRIAKKDPKLTVLANKAVSKETNELFRGLKKTVKNANPSQDGKRRSNTEDDSTSYFN